MTNTTRKAKGFSVAFLSFIPIISSLTYSKGALTPAVGIFACLYCAKVRFSIIKPIKRCWFRNKYSDYTFTKYNAQKC